MSSLSKYTPGFAVALGLTLVVGSAFWHVKPGGTSRQKTVESSVKVPNLAPSAAKAHAVQSYGKLPLSFEANHGQTSKQVKFLTRGPGYTLLLTGKDAVLWLSSRKSEASSQTQESLELSLLTRPSPATAEKEKVTTRVLHMKLAGAEYLAEPIGMDELPGKVNYFVGNDPKKWRSNIPTYAKVCYRNVYPGIDLVYYGHQGQLEYDFVVAPGADPGQIALAFENSTHRQRLRSAQIDEKGNVLIGGGSSVLQLNRPVIYQPKRSTTGGNSEFAVRDSKPVDGRFVLTASNQIRFELGPYDRSQPLVIDPALIYSTFLGGTVAGTEAGGGIGAVDSSGNAFLVGGATSPGFPTTPGVLNPTPPGGSGNAYVAEINAAGTALVYSTYFGPSTAGINPGICGENGPFLTIDSSDNVYLTGFTTSPDFPVTAGAFQTTLKNPQECNAFVTKLNNSGSKLVYSTYLGGTNGMDVGHAITVDSAGDAYVAGYAGSSDFPTTSGAFQTTFGGGQSDAFLTELKPDGTGLVFSTFLGGTGNDGALALARDSAGGIYLVGNTSSTNFPTKSPLQGTLKGTSNAFITKVAPGGATLGYSTYLGGSGNDFALGLVVDGLGNAYVGGETQSIDFPTVNPFQGSCPSTNSCVFASKINPAGSSLTYSTYLGGSSSSGQFGRVFAVDASGNAYIGGQTWSNDFRLLNPIQTTFGGNVDVFVTVLGPSGSALVFSTFLGGSGRDRGGSGALVSDGVFYVAGVTESTDFPVLPGALQTSFAGNSAAFLSKIDLSATATPDYLLLPAPNSLTLKAGTTGTFNVNVLPLGGFNQTVSIKCTGAPSKSTCTPSPSTVMLNGTQTETVAVTLTTAAATVVLPRAPDLPRFFLTPIITIAMLLMALMAFALASSRRRLAVRPALLVLALMLTSLTFLASCGGGGGSSGPPPPPPPTGTPPGNYTLTLTGTSGNLSHSITVSLTVN